MLQNELNQILQVNLDMNMTIKVDCKGCLEGKDTEAEEDNQDLYKLANFNIKETDIDAPENTKE